MKHMYMCVRALQYWPSGSDVAMKMNSSLEDWASVAPSADLDSSMLFPKREMLTRSYEYS